MQSDFGRTFVRVLLTVSLMPTPQTFRKRLTHWMAAADHITQESAVLLPT